MTTDNGPLFRSPEPCRDRIGLIVRAADGSLDADGRAALDAHLETCAACREALEGQRAARAALAAWPEAMALPDFSARVMARLERDRNWLELLDFRRWSWRLSPVVAALAIAAYVTVDQTSAAVAQSSAASGAATEAAAGLGAGASGADASDAGASDAAAVSGASGADAAAAAGLWAGDADLPVSAALWAEDVSESELLTLMLTAAPDASLAEAVRVIETTTEAPR
jgi:anti-sigma factor RsiW